MQTGEHPDNPAPRRRVVLLLVSLPLWLVLSGAGAMWLHFRHEKSQARAEQARFATRINGANIADDVSKLAKVVGERNPGSPAAAKGMGRAVSFIEGSLGPSNLGYAVKRQPAPQTDAGAWPILTARLTGKDSHLPALWLVTAYDSRRGSAGAQFNASGVAALIAAAGALAGESLPRDVVFAFVPHGCDPQSPVAETAAMLAKYVREGGGAEAVLCVEAMGAGGDLWLGAGDSNSRVVRKLDGLGRAVGVLPYPAGFDMASALSAHGIPALRLATREPVAAGENDDAPIPPVTLARSCGHLVELIRRIAATNN